VSFGPVVGIFVDMSGQRSVCFYFLVFFLFRHSCQSQTHPNFHPPLDVPLVLSGNFGELRSNHFHSGLDFKTQGKEGLKVFSSLDGHVSRVKVSPYGFGKALYISHPEGYTTVYAHLSGFYSELDEWVKSEQYRLQKFDVDLFPDKERFVVKKGQEVALSGNSGGSGGPHLHYEIRDSGTEHTLNVLDFGFEISDSRTPDIKGVKVYCMSDSSRINGFDKDLYIPVEKAGSAYRLKHDGPVKILGPVAFGIHATDRLDAAENACGVYKIEFSCNNELVFKQQIDRLSFNLKKHMNAHADYAEMRKNSRDIHRCHILPGNKLSIYSDVKSNGIITLQPEEKSKLKFNVWDVSGNESTLEFELAGVSPMPTAPIFNLSTNHPEAKSEYFRWKQENRWVDENCEVIVPRGALFDDMIFSFRKGDSLKSAFSATFELGDTYTPLSEDFILRIRLPENFSGDLGKLTIVRQDPHNGKQTAIKSAVKEDFLEAESTYFGWFFIAEDKTKPTVMSVDFSPNMKGRKNFTFKISDDLSGVNSYNLYVDGKWALADYDAKNTNLTYTFSEKYLSKGAHKLKLVVTDVVGNKTEFLGDFEW